MRHFYLIGYLILSVNLIYGQKNHDKYFPDYSFNYRAKYDSLKQNYWSNLLLTFSKPPIFMDSIYSEYYRLIYCGTFPSVVSLFKLGQDYIVVADSMNWKSKQIISYKDILYKKEDFELLDSLKQLAKELYLIKNNKANIDYDNYFISNDDRDSWLIEYKVNNKYHVIDRIVPEENVRKYIILLMKLGNESGYRIYKGNNSYDEY